jgi:hypothetical protein
VSGLVVLLVPAMIPVPLQAQDSQTPCSLTDYDPSRRPEPRNEPTEASIAIYVVSIDRINNVDQSYRADYFLSLQWKDPRLGAVVRAAGIGRCRLPIDNVWNPRVVLFNRLEFSRQLSDVVTVDPDGNVEYLQRFQGALRSPFNLRNFPLDTQTLPVTIISSEYGPDELRLQFDVSTYLDRQPRMAGWVIEDEDYAIDILNTYTSKENRQYSFVRFDYNFHVRREIGYFLWRVIGPLTFIVIMSWAIFWIDPSMVGVQIGLASTAILTLIAFLFSLNNVLPPISYLTRMDIFLFASLALVFAAFAEAVITAVLTASKSDKLSKDIDRWARVIFPSAFILVHIAFWTL